MTILSKKLIFYTIFSFILPYEHSSNTKKNIFIIFTKDLDKMSHSILKQWASQTQKLFFKPFQVMIFKFKAFQGLDNYFFNSRLFKDFQGLCEPCLAMYVFNVHRWFLAAWQIMDDFQIFVRLYGTLLFSIILWSYDEASALDILNI